MATLNRQFPRTSRRCIGALLASAALAGVLMLLPGSPAHAQSCSDAGDQPTPTRVDVTAVPIEVESTSADYFVLYASHDLDETTVEYPVKVVLGKEGTTRLTENVASLPMERYRVEKYLIADPADVDGDCTDDITELGDPSFENPVNPAAVPALGRGAVIIPDQETFALLGPAYPSGRMRLKFVLVDMDTDRPSLYFMNTHQAIFREHDPFLNLIGVDPQRAHRGTLVYDPHMVAPDGSHGVYRFRIHENRLSFSFLERAYTLLAANLPLLNDNLVLWIRDQALPSFRLELPLYQASRINLVFDNDVYGETSYIPLNVSEGIYIGF